jgi:acetyltransferase-like isoleucine patch superfamily enzyme
MIKISGGIYIHPSVKIEDDAIIDVKDGYIEKDSIIRSGARIEGNLVKLGQECYLDCGATIGGGSCECGSLIAGDWLHMGKSSHINIARKVEIGDEVGVGIETKIFTHGAYLPIDMGFPCEFDGVKIGNKVWLPNAWVNPGVTIGDNVVVSARSLVNRNLPAGCLAGGIPCRVIYENVFPAAYTNDWQRKLYDSVWLHVTKNLKIDISEDGEFIIRHSVMGTSFNITKRTITGEANSVTEKMKNQFRRNGIRFKYSIVDGRYEPWQRS